MRDDATITMHQGDNTASIDTSIGTTTTEVTMTPYHERLKAGDYQNPATSTNPKRSSKTKNPTPPEPVPDEADNDNT